MSLRAHSLIGLEFTCVPSTPTSSGFIISQVGITQGIIRMGNAVDRITAHKKGD